MLQSSQASCIFCLIDTTRIIASNAHALAIMDGFPISPGHSLVLPKRHIASLFEASREERDAIFDLLTEVRCEVLKAFAPHGFNIGINDGKAAGQTVMHLHIHLIPRYTGDQQDPRGGVRQIFPLIANYWDVA